MAAHRVEGGRVMGWIKMDRELYESTVAYLQRELRVAVEQREAFKKVAGDAIDLLLAKNDPKAADLVVGYNEAGSEEM